MTAPSLPAALRAGAQGLYALEAAAGLVIAHGTWLTREDFQDHIHHGTGLASIDWEAVARSLATGALPSSAGERRLLQLAASLAGQAPVILGDAVTGLDDRNIQALVAAVLHASGRRQFP
jgi:predicted hotdog family 3-hydroxylacyl-ACP dehydratase